MLLLSFLTSNSHFNVCCIFDYFDIDNNKFEERGESNTLIFAITKRGVFYANKHESSVELNCWIWIVRD